VDVGAEQKTEVTVKGEHDALAKGKTKETQAGSGRALLTEAFGLPHEEDVREKEKA